MESDPNVRDAPREGFRYSKNGGLDGVRAVIGHVPGDIDWAVAFNGGENVEGEPGEVADAQAHIVEAARQVDDWPALELFPRFP